MGIQVTIWDDDKTKQEVSKRFQYSSRDRVNMEVRWKRNESILFSTSNMYNFMNMGQSLDYSISQALSAGVDQSNTDVNVAYTFKNLRFIHAQMSANPPSVAMRPTTSDQEDHRKADAADRVVRWAIRHYKMQERVDQLSLHALLYGTGFIKTVWDSTRGDILNFDKESGEITLEGDISINVPFLWNIYLDPDARSWDDCKYVFEKLYMDYDEAKARWPNQEDLLKKAKIDNRDAKNRGRETGLQDRHYNAVELLEYWETGLPTNGYLGRYCIATIDGDLLQECTPSPFRFRKAGAVSKIEASDLPDEIKQRKIDALPEQAQLPYVPLTDVDVPNTPWGGSFVQYTALLQENLNKLDSAILDNIQAHGVARMVLPEATEISEDALSNSPWDVVKITGNQPPYFVNAPQLMPEMTSTRQNIIQGINDVSGVNESMFGQQNREQSGASMQYATNQGNMIRRRLFNKYVLAVESIYKNVLNLVRKHWSIERTIHVLGKEKALEAVDLKGADIDGGYDVIGEYGVTLSLDPITRREEILTLQPMFEKAGIPPRTSMKMLKLNELEGMYDELELADTRQKEVFDQMVATGAYIPPKKYRDHANMIAFAMRWFMSQEFESLPDHIQQLCEQHIEERAQLAAQEQAGTAGSPSPAAPAMQPPQPPGPLPSGPAGPPVAPVGAPQPPTGGGTGV